MIKKTISFTLIIVLFLLVYQFLFTMVKNNHYVTYYIENKEVFKVDEKYISDKKQDYYLIRVNSNDKNYVFKLNNVFNKQKNKKYLLLMIGGAPEGSSFERNIKRKCKDINNLDLIVTGYLFPVPTQLLDVSDVYVTSAGSAWVCSRSGIPTISYDGNDFRPIGVLGRTTNNALFRNESEPFIELSALLDEILEKKSFEKTEARYELNKPNFCQHDIFLSKMAKEVEWFDFKRYKKRKTEQRLSFVLKIVGAETYYKLSLLKKKLFNSNTSDR